MPHKLTDIRIRAAQPRDKPYKLTAGRGVVLVVMPDGAKYWRLRYRYAGREKMLSLGVYGNHSDSTTLRVAMERAESARALLRAGTDPSEVRRQEKIELRMRVARTFGDAAMQWVEFNEPRWRPATVEKVRQYLDKDLLPPLARRPLAHITTPELAEVVAKIEARKAHNVAKKARQWIAAVFEYAIARGLTKTNPAEYLAAVAAPAPPSENHAHLALADLPAFLRALDQSAASPLVKGAAWLALWTANRPGVTRTLRWSELDLAAGLWTIDKGREGMKRGYRHLTPLPTQAVALLRDLHSVTGTFEWVFINRNSPRAPMSDGAVGSLMRAIGYGGRQTAHGFRHLVSTALNERGFNRDWVERQLAHGDPDDIRDTYNKAQYLDQRRKMMQSWADYLDEIKAGGRLLPFRKASGDSR